MNAVPKMFTQKIVKNKELEDDDKISDLEIIKSLLYCFQGVDSQWIKFNQIEKQFENSAKLDFYQTNKVNRLMELGFLHNILQEYIEENSDNENGSIASGIANCLRKELCVYYNSIHQLQKEMNEAVENGKYYSLGNVLCWSILWLNNLQDLGSIVKMFDGEKRGGELVSIIAPFSYLPNSYLQQIAMNMIKVSIKPLVMMMCHWMVDGELLDSYDEFFICKCHGINNLQMWNKRYTIRDSMAPTFFSKKDVNNIFLTGKYINFLHTMCKSKPYLTPSRKLLNTLQNSSDQDLLPMLEQGNIISDMINNICTESSTVVLDILKEKFKLFLHFEGLQRYMLLGQGDFIISLLEILQPHLDKSSGKNNYLKFPNLLDTAVKMSNAQYDDQAILQILNVKLSLTSEEDSGWDIFQLDYTTDVPLETIFEFSGSGKYSILFVFLWRLKGIDFVLSQMWREFNLLMKTSYYIVPELRSILKSTNNLVTEMVHSIRQIQFYVLSDVIETEWEQFHEAFNKALLLETVIDAHNQFLKNIFKRSMLTEETHNLSKTMHQIFKSVLELKGIHEKLHNLSECEMKRRKDIKEMYLEMNSACYTIEYNDAEAKETFSLEVSKYHEVIKNISHIYKINLRKFLKKLIKVSTNDQDALQSLANRINFNQYYTQNDQELERFLTYVCRYK